MFNIQGMLDWQQVSLCCGAQIMGARQPLSRNPIDVGDPTYMISMKFDSSTTLPATV
jgi:hypothetical protein